MLTDKLKGKTLFKVAIEETDEDAMKKELLDTALEMLEECTDHLILAMKTIETLGLLPREDIEDYVIGYMEAFEKRYYSLENDEFDSFIRGYLTRR